MKYAFAGDRQISVTILSYIISRGHTPKALFITEGKASSHATELIELAGLEASFVFQGKAFKTDAAIRLLRDMELDYIFGIHFPLIIPKSILEVPKVGFLNLHPAYLPFNKGWHTPSWAIMEKTPFGVTLHFMSEELDEGDIVHQKRITVEATDTADTLYEKTLRLEVEVFKEAFDSLITLEPPRQKQRGMGTSRNKKDLASIQEIDLHRNYQAGDLIDKLRALTTNNIEEAAYFIKEGKQIAVTVSFTELPNNDH